MAISKEERRELENRLMQDNSKPERETMVIILLEKDGRIDRFRVPEDKTAEFVEQHRKEGWKDYTGY